MVDVDARGGWHNLSHRLTHQIVVIIIHRPRLINHSFVDAVKSILTITHALIDDLAILDYMAQPPHYFLDERQPKDGTAIASIDTPKSQGEPLGVATRCTGNTLTINTRACLANGDGLSYYDAKGIFTGAMQPAKWK